VENSQIVPATNVLPLGCRMCQNVPGSPGVGGTRRAATSRLLRRVIRRQSDNSRLTQRGGKTTGPSIPFMRVLVEVWPSKYSVFYSVGNCRPHKRRWRCLHRLLVVCGVGRERRVSSRVPTRVRVAPIFYKHLSLAGCLRIPLLTNTDREHS
jgi:hypothetical protein